MDSQVADGDVLILQRSVHLSPLIEWPPHCDCVWPPVFRGMEEHFFPLQELLFEGHPRKARSAAGTFSRGTPECDAAARLTVQHRGLGD